MKTTNPKNLMIGLLLTAGLAVAYPTQGAVVNILEHDGAGGVLQSDHFEGDTLGGAPGSWSNTGTPIVRDATTNPPGSVPGGAGNTESTQFVELQAGDEITDSFTPLSSGILTANFEMWNVGNGSTDFSRFRVKFLESDLTGVVGQIGFAKDGTIEGSTLTYNIGEWTSVSLAVNLDAGTPHTVTLTVNGASETINMGTDKNIGGFELASRASGGHTVFIDAQFVAVPEPSTLALLGFGGLMLQLCRRRLHAKS